MDNESLEKLFKLGVLSELISKSKEMVQVNDLCGGHRGYIDDLLCTIENEIYNEIENSKIKISK